MLHFQTRRATSPSTWSTMASPLWSSMFIAEVRRGNQASASHSSFQQQPTPSQIHVFGYSIFHELCFKERRRNPMERVRFGPGNSTLLWALWTCLSGKIASQFLHLNFLGAFLVGILGVTSAEVAVICPDAVSQDSFPPICCKSGCDFPSIWDNQISYELHPSRDGECNTSSPSLPFFV